LGTYKHTLNTGKPYGTIPYSSMGTVVKQRLFAAHHLALAVKSMFKQCDDGPYEPAMPQRVVAGLT
jgi:hypothetical protein